MITFAHEVTVADAAGNEGSGAGAAGTAAVGAGAVDAAGGGDASGGGAGAGIAAPSAGATAVDRSILNRVPHLGHLAVRPSADGRVRSFVPHDPQLKTKKPSVAVVIGFGETHAA